MLRNFCYWACAFTGAVGVFGGILPVLAVVMPKRVIPEESQFCQRKYLFQGKVQEVDSFGFEDTVLLRSVLQADQEAASLLPPQNQHATLLRILSMVGTASGIVCLVSLFMKQNFTVSQTRSLTPRGFMLVGSSFVGLNVLVFGLSLHYSAQKKVQMATDFYNQKNPEDPVVLLFEKEF